MNRHEQKKYAHLMHWHECGVCEKMSACTDNPCTRLDICRECEVNPMEQARQEVFEQEMSKVRAYEVDLSKHLDLGDSWRARGMSISLE